MNMIVVIFVLVALPTYAVLDTSPNYEEDRLPPRYGLKNGEIPYHRTA